MKVSNSIVEKLRNDKDFRLKTALALGVGERTIQNYIDPRNSEPHENLTKMAAVIIYREHGFTDEQIFEKEEIQKNNVA